MRLGGCKLSSSHPAANQKTPFNASRYVLLGLYTFNSLVCAGIYYNGPAVSTLLFRHNAFAFVCEDPATGEYVEDQRNNDKAYICDEQDKVVQNLMPITMAAHFVVSAFAGFILDTFGMRITAVGGMVLHIVAWLLLAFSSPSFNSYIPAFVIMGAACDTGFLPLLLVANLFPGNAALVITILGSAASLSFAVPAVLELVWDANPDWTFRHLCVGYILIGLLPALIVAIFFMPFKSFIGIDKFEKDVGTATDEVLDNITEGTGKTEDYTEENSQKEGLQKFQLDPQKCVTSPALPAKEVLTLPNLAESSDSPTTARRRSSIHVAIIEGARRMSLRGNKSKNAVGQHSESVSRLQTQDSKSFWKNSENSTNQDLENRSDSLARCNVENDVPKGNVERVKRQRFSAIQRQVVSVYFIGITVYFCVVSLATGYYQEASGSRLFTSKGVKDALRWLGPLSCVPCAILGKLIDVVGLMPIIMFVNATGVFTYAFAMIRTDATGYISVLFYCVYLSLFTSQMFCFVEQVFDSNDFGKLAGIITLCGGLTSLIAIPLYNDATVNGLGGDPTAICGMFLGLLLVMFLVVAYLWHKIRKNPKPFAEMATPVKSQEARCNSVNDMLDTTTRRELSFPTGKPTT